MEREPWPSALPLAEGREQDDRKEGSHCPLSLNQKIERRVGSKCTHVHVYALLAFSTNPATMNKILEGHGQGNLVP